MISLFGTDATIDCTGIITAMPTTDAARHATVDPIGAMTRRQALGPAAPAMSLSLHLHRERTDVDATLATLDAWRMAQEVVVVQVIETGAVIGGYLIERVEKRPVWAMPTGEVVSYTVEVALVAPGREGEPSSPAAVAGSDAEQLELAPEPEDRGRPVDDVPPREIARR